MSLGNLNYWPILIAAIVSFAFGAVWYGALSRQWMAAAGISAADMEKAQGRDGPNPGALYHYLRRPAHHGLDALRCARCTWHAAACRSA